MKKKKRNGVKNVTFKGAKIALPIFMDEYTKEYDRKTIIENKVISLATIEIAILTVFIPIIPFEYIRVYLNSNCNSTIIIATLACAILATSGTMMAVSFGILMSAVSVRAYVKVAIEELDLENNLTKEANSVEKGLCDHYKSITIENSILNDKKARKYQSCVPITIISFLLLALGTILLKILK